MPQRGRPIRLDEAKKQQVCAVFRAGGNLEAAAHYVGYCVRTLRNAATDDPDFGDRLARAHASLEVDQVHTLIAHSKIRDVRRFSRAPSLDTGGHQSESQLTGRDQA